METEEVSRKIFTFSLNIHVPLCILAVLGMVLIKVISNEDWFLGVRIMGVDYPLLSFQVCEFNHLVVRIWTLTLSLFMQHNSKDIM